VVSEGRCAQGEWSEWTIESEDSDVAACTSTLQESLTYAGTRESITADFTFTSQDCSEIPPHAPGAFTSQVATCSIRESRTRAIEGSQTENACTFDYDKNHGTLSAISRSESSGAFDKNAAAGGTYAEFLAAIDALASVDISVMPSSVLVGESTRISWSSDRMKECHVRGANGDAWDTLESPIRGAESAPLLQNTVYSITCVSDNGTTFTGSTTVEVR
jgi:hypothetical protein